MKLNKKKKLDTKKLEKIIKNKNTYYNLVIDNNANFILKDIMVIDENNKILDKPKS